MDPVEFTKTEDGLMARIKEVIKKSGRGVAVEDLMGLRLADWRFWIGDSVLYLHELKNFVEDIEAEAIKNNRRTWRNGGMNVKISWPEGKSIVVSPMFIAANYANEVCKRYGWGIHSAAWNDMVRLDGCSEEWLKGHAISMYPGSSVEFTTELITVSQYLGPKPPP